MRWSFLSSSQSASSAAQAPTLPGSGSRRGQQFDATDMVGLLHGGFTPGQQQSHELVEFLSSSSSTAVAADSDVDPIEAACYHHCALSPDEHKLQREAYADYVSSCYSDACAAARSNAALQAACQLVTPTLLWRFFPKAVEDFLNPSLSEHALESSADGCTVAMVRAFDFSKRDTLRTSIFAPAKRDVALSTSTNCIDDNGSDVCSSLTPIQDAYWRALEPAIGGFAATSSAPALVHVLTQTVPDIHGTLHGPQLKDLLAVSAPSLRILDVGCGLGSLGAALHRCSLTTSQQQQQQADERAPYLPSSCTVCGIDGSQVVERWREAHVCALRSNGNNSEWCLYDASKGHVKRADVNCLGPLGIQPESLFPLESFDVIASCDTLFQPPQLNFPGNEALDQIWKWLRPGGIFISANNQVSSYSAAHYDFYMRNFYRRHDGEGGPGSSSLKKSVKQYVIPILTPYYRRVFVQVMRKPYR